MTFLLGVSGRRIIFGIRMFVTFLEVIAYIPVIIKIGKQNCANCHLASVPSAMDNAFITSYADESGLSFFYIGLIDRDGDGTYQWLDGRISAYFRWCPGYPRDSANYCAAMNVTMGGCWQNMHCTDRYAYICERPSDDSIVSSSTPAITALPTTTASGASCSPAPCSVITDFIRLPSLFSTIGDTDLFYITPSPQCETCYWVTIQLRSTANGHLFPVDFTRNTSAQVFNKYPSCNFYDYFKSDGKDYFAFFRVPLHAEFYLPNDAISGAISAQSTVIPGGIVMSVINRTIGGSPLTISLTVASGTHNFSPSWFFNVTETRRVNTSLTDGSDNSYWASSTGDRITWMAAQKNSDSDIRVFNFDGLAYTIPISTWSPFSMSDLQLYSFVKDGFTAVSVAVLAGQRVFVYYVGPNAQLQSTVIYNERTDAMRFIENGKLQLVNHDDTYFINTYTFNWL